MDNEPHLAETAKMGFELAAKLNAEIGMVYAIENIVPASDPFAPVQPVIDFYTEQDETAKTYGKDIMVTQFHPHGISKEEIISTANNWGADLIVMGTHGRTGLGHLILGSVSEYIVRHSKIPVLVVPLKKKE